MCFLIAIRCSAHNTTLLDQNGQIPRPDQPLWKVQPASPEKFSRDAVSVVANFVNSMPLGVRLPTHLVLARNIQRKPLELSKCTRHHHDLRLQVVNFKVRAREALPFRPFSAYREPRDKRALWPCDLSKVSAVAIDNVTAWKQKRQIVRYRNAEVSFVYREAGVGSN